MVLFGTIASSAFSTRTSFSDSSSVLARANSLNGKVMLTRSSSISTSSAPMSMTSRATSSGSAPSTPRVTSPFCSKFHETAPLAARFPPLRVTFDRMPEAARLRLSVRVWIMNPVPPGPYASYVSSSSAFPSAPLPDPFATALSMVSLGMF